MCCLKLLFSHFRSLSFRTKNEQNIFEQNVRAHQLLILWCKVLNLLFRRWKVSSSCLKHLKKVHGILPSVWGWIETWLAENLCSTLHLMKIPLLNYLLGMVNYLLVVVNYLLGMLNYILGMDNYLLCLTTS